MIRKTLALFFVLVSGCIEAPELILDNPYDPGNTIAKPLVPTALFASYRNDSLFWVFWIDQNITNVGFTIERKAKNETTFSFLASRTKSQLDSIVTGPTYVYRVYHDHTVKRSDSSYTYRLKAYRIDNPQIESDYTQPYIFPFP